MKKVLIFFVSVYLFSLSYQTVNAAQVVSKTVPDWVKSLSCQTVKDQNDWNGHTNAREFPAKGVVDNGTWPQLWEPYGCVRTWCENNEMYAYYTWNPGYTDSKAQSNYQIYNWSASLPNSQITLSGIGGNTSAVVDYGSSSTWSGKSIFAQVINGYNEWGYPGVDFTLTCSGQPITGTLTADKTSFVLASGASDQTTLHYDLNGGPGWVNIWKSVDGATPILIAQTQQTINSTSSDHKISSGIIQAGHTYTYTLTRGDDQGDIPNQHPTDPLLAKVIITATTPITETTIAPTGTSNGQLTVGLTLVLGSIDSNDASMQRQPKHQTRHVTLYFYSNANDYAPDPTGTKALIAKGDVTFTGGDPNDPLTYGTFSNPQFVLPKAIQPGNYFVFGKIEGSLRQSVNNPPAPIAVSNGAVLTFAQPLVMGALVSTNNQIQAVDYQAVVTCYGAQSNSVTTDCSNLNIGDDIFSDIPYADLNDDGQVDGIDYNILIRNFGKHGL